MERINNLIPKEYLPQTHGAKSYEEYAQNRVNRLNAEYGHLQGYECKACKNKGYIYYLDDNKMEVARDCECRKIRRSQRLIEESCLSEEINRCTFETFQVQYPFQERMLQKARLFIADQQSQAFFIGGQPGAGKTHICTAIVVEMLGKCIPVIYMSWCQDSKKLKASVNDSKTYNPLINRFKTIDVLYIDDFLKVGKKENPSSADVSLAFEIINHRYQRRNLKTIISSEFDMGQISGFDEALGSRISAMAREFCLGISPDKSKNYRTAKKGQQE